MYNAYFATCQKARKQEKGAPATAGMAKTPGGGLKGREELKALGERNGWTARELSLRDVNAISADETLWHETFNKGNLERAFAVAENQGLNRERQPIWDIRNKWSGRKLVTPEEAEAARSAGATFAERFPTFERTEENALQICHYMADHDLDPKQVSSYVTAFNALVESGKMSLAPIQSADEYLAEHSELHDNRVPPLIAARHQREQKTEAHFAKSGSATNQGSVTRVVDYGKQKHGFPPESDEYSIRMKVRSMSADELAQRCADDPGFRAALDALG